MEEAPIHVKFTKDKPVILLALLGSVLAFANIVTVFARLRASDFKVPVQYIANDGSVLQSANWYSLYSLALFSVLSVGVTIFIAHRIHRGNRLFAIGILIVYVVTASVSLLVTNALLGLVGRV